MEGKRYIIVLLFTVVLKVNIKEIKGSFKIL